MITAAIRERGRAGGLRLLDTRRDLGQVADLIEEVFAGEIGAGGLKAVRELRMMGQFGPLVWLLERLSDEFRDSLTGFVWVEAGRVVGNVTLSRSKPGSQRWHIYNVAVQEAYRGRGIGRRLMEAALELARGRGGAWAILQVRQNNAPAMQLYQRLGFESLYALATLERDGPASFSQAPTPISGYTLIPCRAADWQRRYELALATTSEEERWVRGVALDDFRPPLWSRLTGALGRLLAGDLLWRLCVEREGTLVGALLVQWRADERHGQVSFCVRPEERGRLESWLVQRALYLLGWRASYTIEAEHNTAHPEAIEALRAAGFYPKRTLVTMRLPL